jgi:two-component system sensor histidine kinase/response regulator
MTAHALASDRERCLAAGMDGYLSKPIDPGQLFAVVEQEGEIGGTRAPTAVAKRPAFDVATLRGRFSGDDELLAEVIESFLSDLPDRLAAIGDAVTARDEQALHAAAHTLKGVAASVAADALFEAAGALERIGLVSHIEALEAGWRQVAAAATEVARAMRQHPLATRTKGLRRPA